MVRSATAKNARATMNCGVAYDLDGDDSTGI